MIVQGHRTLGLIALAAALASSAAWADFGSPVTLSPASSHASGAEVVVDADGNAFVVWEQLDGANASIQARARAAGGALGPIARISPVGRDAFDPKVAIDAEGDALVVWRRGSFKKGTPRIQARARSAAGELGPIKTLSDPDQTSFGAEVAVDPDGRALVVWQIDDGTFDRIQARFRSASGALGPIETLSPPGRNAYRPQVAIDADGDALVIWRGYDGMEEVQVQGRARSRPGRWGPVRTFSAGGVDLEPPEVAMESDGDALVVWQADDGIQGRARSAGGGLGPLETFSKAGGRIPEVAIDADGDAVIVWRRSDGTNDLIYARIRFANGDLGETENLSAAGRNADLPEVGVAADGDAVVVWERFNGTINRVQARTLSAAGALGPIETLSAAGGTAGLPQVAVNADGEAVAVWGRHDGAHFRVQAAVGP